MISVKGELCPEIDRVKGKAPPGNKICIIVEDGIGNPLVRPGAPLSFKIIGRWILFRYAGLDME